MIRKHGGTNVKKKLQNAFDNNGDIVTAQVQNSSIVSLENRDKKLEALAQTRRERDFERCVRNDKHEKNNPECEMEIFERENKAKH